MSNKKIDLPGAGSITWKINGEMVLLLGWGRAILMQVAHPMVAEGVGQHSHFHTSPVAKARRLQQTLNRMLEMTFGSQTEALGAARVIDNIHGYVNGNIEKTSGTYAPAGTYYSARDPELLKWVHSTFVDTMLKTYELYVGKLSQQEKDDYLGETSISGPMLGTPPNYFPSNTAELDEYLQEMLTDGRLVIGDRARELADYVLAPLVRFPLLGRLLTWYLTLPIIGLLPEQIRRDYNLRWGKREAIVWQASAWIHRKLVRPLLPRHLALWPMAIAAEKKLAASTEHTPAPTAKAS